jgi:branched-chain amino acid transport system substrate-binding protein
VLALVFAFVLVAGACGRDEEGGSSDEDTPSGTSDDGDGDGDAAEGPATTDACDSYEEAPGITDDSITLGSSFPQSGLFAAFAEIAAGWQAQFDTINEAGGINGRQIEVISQDDEYQPANTTRNVQGLIEEDGVFGLYSVVGTPNNLAIQPEQNANCVPNLFTATGAPQMSVPSEYPWTIGLIPTYGTEMGAFVEYLNENNPSATVAILYQNDDFGEGYFDAFTKLIEGTDITLVADTTYDATNTDVTSQIADLAGSDADTLILGTTTLACPNALGALNEQSGWEPTTYISATCTSSTLMGLAPAGSGEGVMSAFYLKDPADPQWDDDPAMQEFQEAGAAAGLDAEQLQNGIVGYGWTSGAVLAHVFENASALTRVDVMNAAYHIDSLEVGLLLPGITVTTNGTEDPYPIESMQLGSYNGEFWDLQENLYSFEGESGQFSGD